MKFFKHAPTRTGLYFRQYVDHHGNSHQELVFVRIDEDGEPSYWDEFSEAWHRASVMEDTPAFTTNTEAWAWAGSFRHFLHLYLLEHWKGYRKLGYVYGANNPDDH